jgi:hypothetical protein
MFWIAKMAFLTQRTVSSCKSWIITLFFNKNAKIFAENRLNLWSYLTLAPDDHSSDLSFLTSTYKVQRSWLKAPTL